MNFIGEFSKEENSKIKNEFERLKDFHYLDVAGTSLYGENQMKQITGVLTNNFFCNPHSSKSTEDIIDQVRYR